MGRRRDADDNALEDSGGSKTIYESCNIDDEIDSD
jgi:hypothetical protein